ncbi:hypothetical protein FAF44_05680 [Nonomuraea sp. MG754425]|uniref:hypothetical protein n=1 Tax=Nonomuraea sp. MG754425 TaxID=2570319 RepID=UPI001F1E0490|nr:hypothetical protein [Nonomuraea sp. MG754425]MCF6467896.1 hypothetical protein [Nonomuraea sp. MG754425]
MNQKPYVRVMLGLTMLFAVVLAVFSILGGEGIGIVATIGGILLGFGWALTGRLRARRDRPS